MRRAIVVLALLVGVFPAQGAVRFFFTPATSSFGLANPLYTFDCTYPGFPGGDCIFYKVPLSNFPTSPMDLEGVCTGYLWVQFDGEPDGVTISEIHFTIEYTECLTPQRCAFYMMDGSPLGPLWSNACEMGCDGFYLIGGRGITNSPTTVNCSLYNPATRTALLGAFDMCGPLPGAELRFRIEQGAVRYSDGTYPSCIKFGSSEECFSPYPGGANLSPVFWWPWCGDCNCNGMLDSDEHGADCNNNGWPDGCDIGCGGTETDCNLNFIPDSCDLEDCEPWDPECDDCNGNGRIDSCDLRYDNCNNNSIPDECEIADCWKYDDAPWCSDCNGNGNPDECDLDNNDCNCNQIPDDCDVLLNDENINGIPDDCEVDCNENGSWDFEDIAIGLSEDCQEAPGQGSCVPDECDLSECDGSVWCSDCNLNGVPDGCDVISGASGDCNCNSIPDECEEDQDGNDIPDDCDAADCNNNGIPDYLDIGPGGTSENCQVYPQAGSCVPDECDVSHLDPDGDGFISPDCNGNIYPDECEVWDLWGVDCNANRIPDECDVDPTDPDGDGEVAADCDDNGVPDECDLRECEGDAWCDDCNNNGQPDKCDILQGWSEDCFPGNWVPDECELPGNDCNGNGQLDYCDLWQNVSEDCNFNGTPDECDEANCEAGDPDCDDCNGNGVMDECDVMEYGEYYGYGGSDDCNVNRIPDECDIAAGIADDFNGNGVIDECELPENPCCLDENQGSCEMLTRTVCESQGGRWHGELEECNAQICRASLKVTVRDALFGHLLFDAAVGLSPGEVEHTWYDGIAQFRVPSGPKTLTVSRPQMGSDPPYYTVTRELVLEDGGHHNLNVGMSPEFEKEAPEIVEIRSESTSPTHHPHFMDTVSLVETFDVIVDWNYHDYAGVSKLRWIAPGGTFVDYGSVTEWSRAFDVGDGNVFGPGGKLTLVADAGDGTHSIPVVANFDVLARPPGWLSSAEVVAEREPTGGRCFGKLRKYTTFSLSGGGAFDFIEGTMGMPLPSSIDMFGGEELDLRSAFDAAGELATTGTIRREPLFDLAVDNSEKKSKMSGIDVHVAATGGFEWSLNDAHSWLPHAYLHFDAGFRANAPAKPVRFFLGPVPCYFQGYVEAAAAADFNLFLWWEDGPSWDGAVHLDPMPEVGAILGVGLRPLLAFEGALGGGARLWIEFPKNSPSDSAVKKLQIYLFGSARVYLLFANFGRRIENSWDIIDNRGGELGWSEPVLSMTPREYLGDGYAKFVGHQRGGDCLQFGSSKECLLQSNVYRLSNPDLATLTDGLVAVWLHDDPGRTDTNRTELVFSKYDAGLETWSPPVAVADDGTSDADPQVASGPNGDAFAAWENVKDVLIEPGAPGDTCAAYCAGECSEDPDPEACEETCQIRCKLDEALSGMEIAVARYDGSTGLWDPARSMTDNAYLDHSPHIATASDGTALLTWVADPSNYDFFSPSVPLCNLRFRYFDGANWWLARSIAEGVAWVNDLSLAYETYDDDGTERHHGVLVFAADTDGDTTTTDDHELFASTFDGETWTAVEQLTADSAEDANPQAAYDENGHLLLVWYRDGDLVMSTSLSLGGQRTVVDLPAEDSMGAADFKLATGPSGRIVLVWQEPSEDLTDMWAAVYHPDVGPHEPVWSKPRRLTASDSSEDSLEHGLAPVVDNDGDLVVLYDKLWLAYREEQLEVGPNGEFVTISNVPDPQETDLYVLRHQFVVDVAIDSADIVLGVANPMPGEGTRISATIRNLGSAPAIDTEVAFYDGDPDGGGSLIGTASRSAPLAGGDAATLWVPWEVPITDQPHDLYVVVDPAETLDDFDRANNTAVLSGVKRPDLYIDLFTVESARSDDWILTVRVMNISGLAAGSFDVALRKDAPDGELLATLSIPDGIEPGAFYDVSWIWENDGPFEEVPVTVYAVADSGDAVAEFDEENNTLTAYVWNDVVTRDCNQNGYADSRDIAEGTSRDADGSGVPDECETPDQLHVVGPLPNQVAVGTTGTVTGTVEAIFQGLEDRQLVFHKLGGSLTFVSGDVSPDGLQANVTTDWAGRAEVDFTADELGNALIGVKVSGSDLPMAFYVFEIVEAPPLFGDSDGDGDVDLRDFVAFQVCFQKAGGHSDSACSQCDADGDEEIGLVDFTELAASLNGPR